MLVSGESGEGVAGEPTMGVLGAEILRSAGAGIAGYFFTPEGVSERGGAAVFRITVRNRGLVGAPPMTAPLAIDAGAAGCFALADDGASSGGGGGGGERGGERNGAEAARASPERDEGGMSG